MVNPSAIKKYHKWSKSEIEPLVELYESGKTLREVGELHNLSRERVRQIFESVGYKRRRLTFSGLYKRSHLEAAHARRKVLPKAELEKLYLKEKFTLRKISELLSTSVEVVRANLTRHKIPVRSKAEVNEIFLIKNLSLTREKLYRLYIIENKTQLEIAEMFGYSLANIVKMVAKYRIRKYKRGNNKFHDSFVKKTAEDDE
jgi:hypothetical protein